MKNVFEVAAGSIVGRDHCGRGNLLFGKSNQDAFCYSQGAISIGIVCDGCSEGAHSELGARYGALCILNALLRRQVALLIECNNQSSVEEVLTHTRRSVLQSIQTMAEYMDMKEAGTLPKVIAENFLFTALEAADLRAKVERLAKFIDQNPTFGKLSVDEQVRLRVQLVYMQAYLAVLDERIKHFG